MKIVNVQDLITEVSPIYPEGRDWKITTEYMMNTPSEKKTVEDLIQQLNAHGKFREPVYIGTAETEDGVEYSAILNGTHRIVAAIMSNLEKIDVTTERDSDEEYDEDKEEPTIIHCKFHLIRYEDKNKNDEIFDALFDNLRSFKLNDKIWVTTDIATGSEKGINFYYEGAEFSEENLAIMNEKILAFVKNDEFCKDAYISHELLLLDEDEDED